jgi:hypothetical protein
MKTSATARLLAATKTRLREASTRCITQENVWYRGRHENDCASST